MARTYYIVLKLTIPDASDSAYPRVWDWDRIINCDCDCNGESSCNTLDKPDDERIPVEVVECIEDREAPTGGDDGPADGQPS